MAPVDCGARAPHSKNSDKHNNARLNVHLESTLNPRRAGAPKLPWSAGGGASRRPPSNSAPRRRSGKRKQRLKARQKSFQNYFSHFFAQVNIEVFRGHQRSNFAKFHIFRKSTVISETIIGRKLQKSANDSP